METDALKRRSLAWVTPVTVELEKPSTDLPGRSWEIGAFDCSYVVVVLHKETVLTRGLFRAGFRFSLSPSALTGAVAAHDSLNTLPHQSAALR